jgi:septal ring factor EnvC (AmiA/AmiB activator)
MSVIKSAWFSIDQDQQIEKNDEIFFDIDRVDLDISKKLELLEKRIQECENINISLLSSIEELKKKIDTVFEEDIRMKSIIEEVHSKIKQNETSCNIVRNENLKLINRILEAEISVERTTNILLRKNISFPFTKINL